MDANNKKYEEMALKIEQARKKIFTTFKCRERSKDAFEEWSDACSEYRTRYDTLHQNEMLYPDYAKLKKGDLNTIQVALNYLSADVYYVGSGYNKERITTLIKHLMVSNSAIFTAQQLKEVDSILLNKITAGERREFIYYCRLAHAVPAESLQDQIKKLLNSSEPAIRRRARLMLDYLRK